MEENQQLEAILQELLVQTRTLQGMAGTGPGSSPAAGKSPGGKSPLGRDLDKASAAARKLAAEQKKAAGANADQTKQTTKLATMLGVLTDTTNGLEKNFERTQHAAASAANALGRDLVGSIRRSMSNQQRTASQFGSTVESAGNALGSGVNTFVRSFNPLSKGLFVFGGALKGATVGLFKLGKAAIDQQQQMFDAYQSLSKVGVSAGGDLNALLNIIHTAGFSLAQAETVAKSFSAHSQTVAAFGDTAADGAKNMAAMSGELIKSDMGRHLREMGYQREELLDIMMQYATTQMATGKLQQMTTRQQATAVYKYVQELDTATRLTGVSNADLLKQEERRRADERVSAARAMRPDEYNQMKPLFDMLASLDPQLLQGVEHIFAGQGAITSPEARAAIMQIPEIRQVMADMLSGGDSITAVQSVVSSLERTVGPNGRFTRVMSVAGELQGIGKAGVQREFITRLKNAKSMEEIQAVLDDQKNSTTGAAQAMVNIDDSLVKGQQEVNKLVNRFGQATEVVAGFTTALADAATFINDKLPGGQGTFGGTPVAGGSSGAGAGGAGARPGSGAGAGGAGARPGSGAGAGGAGARPGSGAGAPGAPGQSTSSGAEMLNKLLDEFGVTDPSVRRRALALAQVESSMNPNARGPMIQEGMHRGTQAHGLLQLMPLTAREVGADISTPEGAARGGLQYFLKNYKTFGNLDLATIAHHAGPGGARRFKESGDAGTRDRATGLLTNEYLKKVVSKEAGFRDGGIASGPDSGHMQLLHGTEAVVPLGNGKSIPVEVRFKDLQMISGMSVGNAGPSAGYSRSSSGISSMEQRLYDMLLVGGQTPSTELATVVGEQLAAIDRQTNKLNDLVDAVKKGNDINAKILRMSQ